MPELSPKTPSGNKGTSTLKMIVGLFMALGVAGLVWGAVGAISALRTSAWPTAGGTIIESAVVTYETRGGHRDRINETMYSAKVVYEYNAMGKTRRGNTVRMNQIDTSDIADVKRIVAHYPKGKSVTVHYDPDQPDRASVLETGVGPGVVLPIGFGLFLIIFPLGFYYAWNKLEQQEKGLNGRQ